MHKPVFRSCFINLLSVLFGICFLLLSSCTDSDNPVSENGNGKIDIKGDPVKVNDISGTWITTKIHAVEEGIFEGEKYSDSYNYEDEETHIVVFDKSGNLNWYIYYIYDDCYSLYETKISIDGTALTDDKGQFSDTYNEGDYKETWRSALTMDGNTLRIVNKGEWSDGTDDIGTETTTFEFKNYSGAVPPSSWPEEECDFDFDDFDWDDLEDLEDYGDFFSLRKSRSGNNQLRKAVLKKRVIRKQ